MAQLFMNFKKALEQSWLVNTLLGVLIFGGIPAISYLLGRMIGCPKTEGILAAIIVSAAGGAAGGIAVYLTQTMVKKGRWRAYLSFIIIVEAYVLTTIIGILTVIVLYPSLRDEDLVMLFLPSFHLFSQFYVIFLATVSFGVYSLNKLIQRRKKEKA